MMREIKFRAWDSEKQIWVSNGEIEYSISDGTITVVPNTIEHMGDSVHDMYVADRFTIDQYTGLKDKDGKEIYENDIVKIYYHWMGDYENDRVIKFHDGAFIVDDPNEKRPLANLTSSMKVIGNIYETPELIQEGR